MANRTDERVRICRTFGQFLVCGVSMGSLLGLVLANIFVDFHECHLFEKYYKPHVYRRYVDDTFSYPISFPLSISLICYVSGKWLYFAFF